MNKEQLTDLIIDITGKDGESLNRKTTEALVNAILAEKPTDEATLNQVRVRLKKVNDEMDKRFIDISEIEVIKKSDIYKHKLDLLWIISELERVNEEGDWLCFKSKSNKKIFNEEAKKNCLCKFEDGTVINYIDEHPMEIMTHFKIVTKGRE